MKTKDHFPIEKGIERTSNKHRELVLKILNSMMKVKDGESFLVPTEDKGQAKSVQASVNYLKHKYKRELEKGTWTTMTIYNKGKQVGVRVFFDI